MRDKGGEQGLDPIRNYFASCNKKKLSLLGATPNLFSKIRCGARNLEEAPTITACLNWPVSDTSVSHNFLKFLKLKRFHAPIGALVEKIYIFKNRVGMETI